VQAHKKLVGLNAIAEPSLWDCSVKPASPGNRAEGLTVDTFLPKYWRIIQFLKIKRSDRRESFYRSCWMELTHQGILLRYDRYRGSRHWSCKVVTDDSPVDPCGSILKAGTCRIKGHKAYETALLNWNSMTEFE